MQLAPATGCPGCDVSPPPPGSAGAGLREAGRRAADSRELCRPLERRSGGGPPMNQPAATTWEARPVPGTPRPPGAGHWGVVYRPSGRWVAFGSEARCRRLAAHLTEVDAILTRPPPPGATEGPGGRG